MGSEAKIFNFILYGNFTDESINLYLKDNKINMNQLLRDTYRYLLDSIFSFKNDEYYTNLIKNGIDLFCVLCNKISFDKDAIDYNRKRIKKLREPILVRAKETKNDILLEAANNLDDIVLDKNIDPNTLENLIIKLINRFEDIDIIKKFININKESITKKNNELFDYVFYKAIASLDENSRDIYYYITLLKLLYSSSINKDKYLRYLHDAKLKDDLFGYEIYLIVNGVKRGLNTDEILDKYGIVSELPEGTIIKCESESPIEGVITIDGNNTYLRDDGISIKKDGNKFIVGIHVADAGGAIKKNSELDLNARNNYECMYMRNFNTRMFPFSAEYSLSLNEGSQKGAITLYVVLNDSGDLIDYYIEKNNIIVSKNMTYLETEEILNNMCFVGVKKQISDLFELANALSHKNHSKQKYWEKKEKSKTLYDYKKLKSDIIVREFMSLYNLLLARIAKDEGIPYIYRKQDDEYISSIVNDMGICIDDYTRRVLENVYMESVYTEKPSRHFGLGYDVYSHSSDPLRRYPDFYNQYLMHQFYFKDIDNDFDSDEFHELVRYINQRNTELSLMRGELEREARLSKKK